VILPKKIDDVNHQIKGTQTEEKEKGERQESSLAKTSIQTEYFLNESFAKDFFERRTNLSDFRILNCEINPLKIRRNKSVIEFKLDLNNKRNHYYQQQQQQQQPLSKSIIAKWRDDRRGKEIFDLLQEVWQKGFSMEGQDQDDPEDQHLKIYEPIGYFDDYNFMLTSKANGLQLKNILTEEEEQEGHVGILELHVKQAAMWLVKLHSISSSNLTHANIYSMQQEEEKLKGWSEHLSIHRDFGKQLQSMLTCILKTERSLTSKCFVLIHNGFHPGNIFVDGPDLTVIDFDHSCIFDPAVDLGYFSAKLLHIKREYNLSLDVERLEKCFLDKYAAELISSEDLERVDLYKARSYLRHLHSKYCQQLHSKYNHNEPDPVDFEYWVKKAEECLKRWM
jgi:thiamine kinase-like enzyme